MSAALDLILNRLFDYAGMFPPARESMEQALKSAAAAPKTLKRPELLGNEAVLSFEAIRRLRPADLQQAGFDPEHPVKICALGSPLSDQVLSPADLTELREVGIINGSTSTTGPVVKIVSYECAVNSAQLYQLEALKNIRNGIGDALGGEKITIALEVPATLSRWQHYLDLLAEGLKRFLSKDSGVTYQIKIRCGGTEPAARDQVATAIEIACERQIGIKVTAGLHHPIVERVLYQNEMGFLNLCVAYALKHQIGKTFTHREITTCLGENQPSVFSFEDGVRWRDFSIDLDQLRTWKVETRFTIGSCSLIEPDSDLTRLFGNSTTIS